MNRKLSLVSLIVILITSINLAGCQPASVSTPAVQETAAPSEEVSKVGGTVTIALSLGPDTLDMQKTANGQSDYISTFIGSALVAKDPLTNEVVPYMATSWEIAEDGLTYTFHLKEGIKFHDGTPFTANDYAFTINRALDPATASPGTAGMIAGVQLAEAPDATTLVIKMAVPNAVLLENLALPGYMMPYSQAYVEAHDDEFLGQNPMSTGPYIFKEWITGDRVVLERNPEFTWGPAFGPGPFNIQTLEFRIIPEEATIASGLEVGEIDIFETSSPALIQQLQGVETLHVEEGLYFGISALILNTALPKLADLEMRQAINYALNRQAIVDVVQAGFAIPAYGAFSPAVYGYNEELDQLGYDFDPDKAKQLIEGLGYTANTDGMYEKDGELLTFAINTMGTTESAAKMAQVVQQQLKEVGITSEINLIEFGAAIGALMGGQFEMSIMDYGMPNASILSLVFGSQGAGYAFFSALPDSVTLFEQVAGITSITNPEAWLENVKNAQKTIIIDQALIAPLYVPKEFLFYNANLADLIYSKETEVLLNNAYILQE